MLTPGLFVGIDLDERPWRPVVSPYRPRAVACRRQRRPLQGQMWLPGMAIELGEVTTRDKDGGKDGSAIRKPGCRATAVCPNCAGITFDEEGDCTTCWEPGVVRPESGTG